MYIQYLLIITFSAFKKRGRKSLCACDIVKWPPVGDSRETRGSVVSETLKSKHRHSLSMSGYNISVIIEKRLEVKKKKNNCNIPKTIFKSIIIIVIIYLISIYIMLVVFIKKLKRILYTRPRPRYLGRMFRGHASKNVRNKLYSASTNHLC